LRDTDLTRIAITRMDKHIYFELYKPSGITLHLSRFASLIFCALTKALAGAIHID